MVDGDFVLAESHFDDFIEYFEIWLKYFYIADWEISYTFFPTVDADGDQYKAATVVHDRFNRLAEIRLSGIWDIEPEPENLCRVAFHECMELLLADIHLMASSRHFDTLIYDREHHRLIRKFESTIMKDLWENQNELFDIQSSVEEGDGEGQGVSEDDNDEALPRSWVRSVQRSLLGRWINCISPRS